MNQNHRASAPKKNVKQGLPWYRYPVVWIFLVIVPLLTLIASAVTIYIAAASNHSGGPHESYIKKALSPNELAPREEKAKSLSLSATLTVTSAATEITFDKAPPAGDLIIKFQHPTLEKFDFSESLTPQSSTRFVIKRPDNLRQNKWDIFVDAVDGSWRIKGRLLKSERNIRLTPFGQ